MQTVERPQGAIAGLRERLHDDPRHKGLLMLLSGTARSGCSKAGRWAFRTRRGRHGRAARLQRVLDPS